MIQWLKDLILNQISFKKFWIEVDEVEAEIDSSKTKEPAWIGLDMTTLWQIRAQDLVNKMMPKWLDSYIKNSQIS